jgi:ATP-dependent RNA helicase DDX27
MFGLTAAELHGNLTQEQRLDALELFRDAKVDFLIASDIASRGLDIIGIETVINFNMPRHISNYIHRVGRTARAGKAGRAVSLVCDGDRKLFKEVVKNAGNNVRLAIPRMMMMTKDFVFNMVYNHIDQAACCCPRGHREVPAQN